MGLHAVSRQQVAWPFAAPPDLLIDRVADLVAAAKAAKKDAGK
jgi:hypothetical protein